MRTNVLRTAMVGGAACGASLILAGCGGTTVTSGAAQGTTISTAASTTTSTVGKGVTTSTVVQSVPTDLAAGEYIVQKPGPSNTLVPWVKFSRLDGDTTGFIDRQAAIDAANGPESPKAESPSAVVESANLVLYTDPGSEDAPPTIPTPEGTIKVSPDSVMLNRPAWLVTYKTEPYDATYGRAKDNKVIVSHFVVLVDAKTGSVLRSMPVT